MKSALGTMKRETIKMRSNAPNRPSDYYDAHTAHILGIIFIDEDEHGGPGVRLAKTR